MAVIVGALEEARRALTMLLPMLPEAYLSISRKNMREARDQLTPTMARFLIGLDIGVEVV